MMNLFLCLVFLMEDFVNVNSSIIRVHGSVTESMIIVRVCDIYEVSKSSAAVLSVHIICYFLLTMFFFFSLCFFVSSCS